MTPQGINRDALERIKAIIGDELKVPDSEQTRKRVATTLRNIAFLAEVAAQELEGMPR